MTCNGQGRWEPQSPECLRKSIILKLMHFFFQKDLVYISVLILMCEIINDPPLPHMCILYAQSLCLNWTCAAAAAV